MHESSPRCNCDATRRASVRRRALLGLVAACGLFFVSAAIAEPTAPTVDAAAKALQAALEAGDEKELAAWAARGNPDPWLVAEALLAQGHAEAAAKIAALAPRREIGRLGEYVAAKQGSPTPKKRREQLARAQAKLADDPGEAVKILTGAPVDAGDVVAVDALYVHGRALQALDKNAAAAQAFEACARTAAKLGWLGRASTAYEQLVRSLIRRSDFKTALARTKDWSAVEATLGSKQGQARAACLQALAHVRLGALDEAAKLSKTSLATLEPLADHPYVASALSYLGYIAFARGQRKEGRDFYERAIAQLAKPVQPARLARFAPDADLHDRTRISLMTSAAGYAFYLGERDAAWKRLTEAAKAAEARGWPELQARAQQMDGALRQAGGDMLEALARFEAAAKSFARAGNRAGTADVLRRVGTVRHALGDYPAALASLEAALKVLVATGAQREVVLTHLAMSRTHMANGEPRRALDACVKAREAAAKLGATPLDASALRHMGDAHVLLGEYARSLERHTEALAKHRAAQDIDGTIHSLTDLGHVHTLLGATDKALEVLDEARSMLDDTRSAKLKGAVHLWIAKAQLVAQEGEGTGELLQQAHTFYTQARDHHGAASALAAAVSWYRAKQDFQLAIEKAEVLAGLYTRLKDQTGIAMARLHKALSLQALGRSDEGLQVMKQALSAAQEAASVSAVVQCLWGLAQLHAARGEHAQAMAAARSGLAAMDRLGRHLAEGEGAAARSQFATLFDIGAESAVAAGNAEELYYFLESGRSKTLLAALGGRDALRSSVIPEELRAAEAKARAEEAMALARLRRAQSLRRFREIKRARSAWMKASGRVQEVIERIQRTARAQADLVYPTVAALDDVRAGLRPEEALLLFGLTERQGMALVVTRDEARIVDLGAEAPLTEACQALLMESRPYIDESKLAEVRKLVVEPLKLAPGVKRVLVSPDGITAYLPFALLIEDREIAYAASASVHGRLAAERSLRGERILALGDPVYAKRSSKGGSRAGSRGQKLARLKATNDEVKAIGDDVLLREKASETELRKALADETRRRAVHLACHGLIDPQNPTQSSLALTADEDNDGFLTALDVFRLPIRADLATLSACETGKGRVVRGEGIVGLTRAFLFAGAPRVIVSLWKVDDEATQALMVEFYKRWNPKDGSKGISAAAALRAAQAHVRAQEKWKHPYYWAAWVLWGLPD